MKVLTIRNISEKLSQALELEKQQRHLSLNKLVNQLLAQALGINEQSEFDNGLSRFAGGWSDEDFDTFEKNTECFNRIDDAIWE